MPKLDVLVVGSTGLQGGAVARALLRGGHDVRALTRNLAHPAAEALRLRGARLAWTDLDDRRRLEDVARGVDAIFAVTTPSDGLKAESRHGLTIADLAQRLGIPHVVFSSSMSAAQRRGVPDIDSKHEIEQYLRAASVPHTVVCPAFLMENFLRGELLDALRRHELPIPLGAHDKLQQLAAADLGRFVRLVLERRDEFLGARVNIAADDLTPIEIAATLARAFGRSLQHVPPADGDNPAFRSFAALAEPDARADIVALRTRFAEVNWHTLADWAKHQDWSVLQSSYQ